jgi:hypothetical protein
MPNLIQNVPWLRKLFFKGANTDIRPEARPEGVYEDAQNMRPRSIDGNTGAMEAIGGEELLWPAPAPGLNYVCIGSEAVNNKVIEFWCSSLSEENPIVRVDGIVVAQSPNIPYRSDRPLQVAVNERCRGGMVYPADHASPPLRWDVDDLLENLAQNTGKYFANYNPQENSAIVLFSPQWPRHRGNPVVGQGLAPGQYIYYLRAVLPGGDLTNPGPESPPISVGRVQDPTPFGASNPYPAGRSAGGYPDPLAPTIYGVALEFRIDNAVGYTEYQVCRRRFNDGQGLNGAGIDEVVGRIPTQPGDFLIYQFLDPVNANEAERIPPDELVDQQIYIDKPKSVEYSDNRLHYGNFETLPKSPSAVFRQVNSRTCVPFTRRVTSIVDGQETNTGYGDPRNNTYLRSYMRGERYGFGLAYWDGSSSKTFAQPIEGAENFAFPERRDIKGANGEWGNDSELLSSDPLFAATVETSGPFQVERTFEAFEQGSTQKGVGLNVNVVSGVNGGSVGYNPLRPINAQDSGETGVSGYFLKPNDTRYPVQGNASTEVGDTGAIHAPRYHALGLHIYGPLRSSIPQYVKVLTIGRTPPAGRVVAQGMASYTLIEQGLTTPARKITNGWDWYSRDVYSGVAEAWDQVEANPTRFNLRAVSPLGFYNETYGWRGDFVQPAPDASQAFALDMLLYAGVQRDQGQVNAGDGVTHGVQPQIPGIPGGNYTAFGVWRHNPVDFPPVQGTQNENFWQNPGNNGNTPIQFAASSAITPVTNEGGAGFYRFTTDNFVYMPGGNSTNFDIGGVIVQGRNFDFPTVRRFHQPFYVVNVIDPAASVGNLNIERYIQVNHRMMESCIGVTNLDAVQSFRLVNEELYDVLGRFNTDLRYVWVQTPGQPIRAWVCVTGNNTINGATILADIAVQGFATTPDGTEVYGIYEVSQDNQGDNFVNFGTFAGSFTPPEGSRILVRYDENAGFDVFGGDTTIGPCIHSVIEREYNDATNLNTAFPIGGLPLPYPGFGRSPGYFKPITGNSVDQNPGYPTTRSIRQLAIMWDCETRCPSPFLMDQGLVAESFPRRHYKLRPYDFDPNETASQNGLFAQYDLDYPRESTQWGRGGICTENNLGSAEAFNLDYSKQPTITLLGTPQNGFVEQTDFCTSIIASLQRDPLAQDLPGIQTFLQSNIKAISEETGEIKYIASLLQGNSRNMYAITQTGAWLVMTNKNILTGANAQDIGLQSISNYWGDAIAIDRAIGCPDQFWRLLARGAMPSDQGYQDTLTWPDRNGWYRLAGNQVVPIGRDNYLKVLLPILRELPTGYGLRLNAFCNPRYEEVWNTIIPGRVAEGSAITSPMVLVWNPLLGSWTARYTYDFDSYTARANTILGHRNLEAHTLDVGDTISGVTRQAWVETAVFDEPDLYKELMRWRANGTKPDYVEVYDESRTLISRMDATIGGAGWAKLYDGYEGWVFKTLASLGPRVLPQGMGFYVRFGYTTFGAKVLKSAALLTKALK